MTSQAQTALPAVLRRPRSGLLGRARAALTPPTGTALRSAELLTAGAVGASGTAVLLGSASVGVASLGVAVGMLSLRQASRPGQEPTSTATGWSAFARELERSRRSGDPLSLVRLRPPAGSPPVGPRLPGAAQALRASACVFLSDGDVVLVLPGAGREAALLVAERVAAGLGLPACTTQCAGAASFPADGLTLAMLVAAAAPVPAGSRIRVNDRPLV